MKLKIPAPADLMKHRLAILCSVLTLLAIAIVHFLWIDPVLSQKDSLLARVKQQEEAVRKYEKKLAQAESIKESLLAQELELEKMQKKLFRGADPYQLAGSLGDLLSPKGSEDLKLDIKTYQVLASKEHGMYQEVHLRFNLMTTVDGLYYFLSRIRTSEFAILVQEINVQKIQKSKGPDLVINVTLSALMEKGEGHNQRPGNPAPGLESRSASEPSPDTPPPARRLPSAGQRTRGR